MTIARPSAALRIALFLLISLTVGGCGADLTPDQHVARAEEFRGKGDLEAAAIELKNALQKEPNSVGARLSLGLVYLDAGDSAAAEKELSRAATLGAIPEATTIPLTRARLEQRRHDEVIAAALKEPNGPAGFGEKERAELYALWGDAYLGLQKLEVAQRQYESALALAPGQARALLGQARLAVGQGRLDEARERVAKAIEVSPKSAAAWSFRGDLDRFEDKPQDAEKAYSEAIANRADNLEEHLSRALVRVQLGKLDEAAKDVAAVERRAPRAPGGKYGRGLIAFAKKDYPAAGAAFQQALAADPNYLPAVYYLGIVQALTGELEQAEANMSRAVSAYRSSDQAAKILAAIRLQKGDFAGAEAMLQPVLARSPNDVEALELMGDAALGRGKPKEGVTWLQKAVEQEARTARTYVKLGLGMVAAGDVEKGAEALELAAELDPDRNEAEQALFRTYLRSRQYDQALKVAEKLRQEDPKSPLPDNLAGVVCMAARQPDKAREAFARSLDLSKGYPAAAHNLAAIERAQGHPDKARALYEQVLQTRPDHLSTLLALAMLDAQEGKIDQAKARLERAVDKHPEALQPRLLLSRYYVRTGQPDKALGMVKPIEPKQRDNPELLMEIGIAQLQGGNPASAAETLRRLTEVAPRYAGGHYFLAQALAQLGDSKGSLAALDRALSADPTDLLASLAKIRVLILDGDFDSADALIQQVKKKFPKLADLATREAELATARKQPNEAVAAYRRALELDPGGQRVVSLARAQLLAGDKAGAFASLQDWLRAYPQDPLVQSTLASAYLSTGDEGKAREALVRSLELNPRNALDHNNLAWLLRDSDPKTALVHAEKARELAPETAQVLDTLGVVLARAGQPQRGADVLREAVSRAPNAAYIRYHLATVLDAAGQRQEAVRVLEQLLADKKEFPERPDAQRLLERLSTSR